MIANNFSQAETVWVWVNNGAGSFSAHPITRAGSSFDVLSATSTATPTSTR